MAKQKSKTVRLLEDVTLSGRKYPCNSLLNVSNDMAAQLVKDSRADATPEAIEYLLKEGVQIVDLVIDTDDSAENSAG